MKKLTAYFSRGELILWGVSSGLILISFLIFDRVNTIYLTITSLGTAGNSGCKSFKDEVE